MNNEREARRSFLDNLQNCEAGGRVITVDLGIEERQIDVFYI